MRIRIGQEGVCSLDGAAYTACASGVTYTDLALGWHTFAVRSLEQCRQTREEVARHIVALSTYLGHAHVTDTYWYLQATPFLMERIAEAGETLYRGGDA